MFKETLKGDGEVVVNNWKPLTVSCTRDNVRLELNPEKIRGGWQLTAEHVKVRDGWTNYGHSFWASVLSISWAGNPAL